VRPSSQLPRYLPASTLAGASARVWVLRRRSQSTFYSLPCIARGRLPRGKVGSVRWAVAAGERRSGHGVERSGTASRSSLSSRPHEGLANQPQPPCGQKTDSMVAGSIGPPGGQPSS
jgi:hypothetical protein